MTDFDEATLVIVAATALRTDPDILLDGIDVAALARVAGSMDSATEGPEAASAAMIGFVQDQPLPWGNAAAGWLCAMLVLRERGANVEVDDVEARRLLEGAAEGRLGVRELAAALAAHVTGGRRRRGFRRWRREASQSSGSAGRVFAACGACGRRVERRLFPGRWIGPMPEELMALCARQHGTHDRSGRKWPHEPAPEVNTVERMLVSVVVLPAGDREAFVVPCDPVMLLVEDTAAGTWDVYALGDLTPGDLTRPTDALIGRSVKLGEYEDAEGLFASSRRDTIDARPLRTLAAPQLVGHT